MSNDGYPSIGCKQAIAMAVSMVIVTVVLLIWLWPRPVIVRADGIDDRFEPISKSEWVNGYQFSVFHDKASGQEFICAVNDSHWNPTCFPSGRSWK